MYKRKIATVTPPLNDKAKPSPDSCSTSANTPNQNDTPHKKSSLLTPCRSIGLKRKYTKSQLPTNFVQMASSTTSASCSQLELQAPFLTDTPNQFLERENDTKSFLVTSVKRTRKPSNVTAKEYSQNYLEELKNTVQEKRRILSSDNLNTKKKGTLELQDETIVWRKACQQALEDLLVHVHAEACNKQDMDMMQLLNHLSIPAALVNYDTESQEFQ